MDNSTPRDPVTPPMVYRIMKRDTSDNLPVVGSGSSSELGARPHVDIAIDAGGNVVLDGTGMSVAPNWRMIHFTRIPKRLRHIVPGALGSDKHACFSMGAGPFERGLVTVNLELLPDETPPPVNHGVIAPVGVVPLEQYQSDLAGTRALWKVDEA